MAKHLDNNQAAYLAAFEQDDPKAENWTSCWRLVPFAKEHGADFLAQTTGGSFAVCKELARRKLVDKAPGRNTLASNGYAINEAGRDALRLHRQEQED